MTRTTSPGRVSLGKKFGDFIGGFESFRLSSGRANGLQNARRRQPLLIAKQIGAIHGAQDGGVRRRKRRRQIGFEHLPPHGVGTRFEHGPQSTSRPAMARGVDRHANRRRMMRKIIDDQDARRFPFYFQPPQNSAESRHRAFDGCPARRRVRARWRSPKAR